MKHQRFGVSQGLCYVAPSRGRGLKLREKEEVKDAFMSPLHGGVD